MDHDALLKITSHPRATIATILCKEFDYHGTTRFKTELAGVTDGDSKLPLVLDLTNVGFMPSVTLGALVELRNRLSREKRPLTLVGMQPAIVKLMEATGMLNLFDVRDRVTDVVSDA